jgi:pantoate--beta-alanine ligase
MQIIRDVRGLKSALGFWREPKQRIGFVPTMGALHAGHLALVEAARQQCDAVVVSIFINPLQFGPNEDFGRYPRQEAQDAALLKAAGAHLLYLPSVESMYPEHSTTRIEVGKIGTVLCGAFRPGHFSGVATVVCKLLMQVGPHTAWFGEKDYQQLHIIRRMVRDLDLPVAIEGFPTVRETDGLALSSRNAYLTPEERLLAPQLYATLQGVGAKIRGGMLPGAACREGAEQLLAAGFRSVDYLECRDSATLSPLETLPTAPARLLAAVHLGHTRLIDNIPLS